MIIMITSAVHSTVEDNILRVEKVEYKDIFNEKESGECSFLANHQR